MGAAKRRVAVILVDRANYGRLKPVAEAIHRHPDLEVQIICAGAMVLERFGRPADVVRDHHLPVTSELYIEVEGGTPVTMAKSVGLGVIEFAGEFQRLRPDLVLLIGDRYEALSAAIAAALMNLPVVHLQGGEVSGSVDESTRHAISKFAQFHVPATQRAADYLVRMGERRDTILTVGCPSSDLARACKRRLTSDIVNVRGSGIALDVDAPFLLAVLHPNTTEFDAARQQMETFLLGLSQVGMQTLLLWPNIDPGSSHIAKAVREYRTTVDNSWLRVLTNVTPEDYLTILATTACAVGNSSSFVRDASFFGTPVVLVGNRQEGREMSGHVVCTPIHSERIVEAVQKQLRHGSYPPSDLYGDGHVSRRLADSLVRLEPYVQKRLAYVDAAPRCDDAVA